MKRAFLIFLAVFGIAGVVAGAMPEPQLGNPEAKAKAPQTKPAAAVKAVTAPAVQKGFALPASAVRRPQLSDELF